MPKVKTLRKPTKTRKDSEGGLLNKQIVKKEIQTEEGKDRHQNNITKHVYDPIYNSYFNTEKKIEKPKNPSEHWTKNKYHENWIRLHHIQQQRTFLHYKFLEKVEWDVWEIINTYNQAEYQLLVEQKITLFEEIAELEVSYTTLAKPGTIRNKRNSNYIKTFYQHNIIQSESEDEYIDELLPIKTENQSSPSCPIFNNSV